MFKVINLQNEFLNKWESNGSLTFDELVNNLVDSVGPKHAQDIINKLQKDDEMVRAELVELIHGTADSGYLFFAALLYGVWFGISYYKGHGLHRR